MGSPDMDYILVPLGLMLMAGYHLWLLLYISRRPTMTVIGINAINRRIWVQAMMEDPVKSGVLAVQTLRNNIMASTLLASTSIMLCSLLAILITNNNNGGNGGGVQTDHQRLAGTKFFSILLCFLVAFLLNVQSVRYYSHASILINVPVKWERGRRNTPDYVASLLDRGTYCWSLGLRACYFSFPLFLWIFSAVAMVACCVVMVVVLYFLDVYVHWGEGEEEEEEEEGRRIDGV